MKTLQIYCFILLCLLLKASAAGQVNRCLFVGDSYFSHNDLPGIFLEIWQKNVADSLLVSSHNRDGSIFLSQWQADSFELSSVLKSKRWDFVVLELPPLAKPQNAELLRVLSRLDSILDHCVILCITMDVCKSFPEMECERDKVEGVKCNSFSSCDEKLTLVKMVSQNLGAHEFKNKVKIIPFFHYRTFLRDEFAIELENDDNYGHPSITSHFVLAYFILYCILNEASELNYFKLRDVPSEFSRSIIAFYNSYN